MTKGGGRPGQKATDDTEHKLTSAIRLPFHYPTTVSGHTEGRIRRVPRRDTAV